MLFFIVTCVICTILLRNTKPYNYLVQYLMGDTIVYAWTLRWFFLPPRFVLHYTPIVTIVVEVYHILVSLVSQIK